MQDFASILLESPPADDSKPVIVPGMIELAKMEEQRQLGIKLSADTLAILKSYSA
jgi:LDH2 family malate/lactate/ureidoglycolate dehydrogenase